MITAGYHMHETVRRLRGLPEAFRRVTHEAVPLLYRPALELAGIMKELGDRDEKESGVVAKLARTMARPSRIHADLDEWEAKGFGSAACGEVWRTRRGSGRL